MPPEVRLSQGGVGYGNNPKSSPLVPSNDGERWLDQTMQNRNEEHSMGSKLVPGQLFPRLQLKNIHGVEVSVPGSAPWTHVQLRRFAGCPICNLHLQSFIARQDEIANAGIREVVIFHSSECPSENKLNP